MRYILPALLITLILASCSQNLREQFDLGLSKYNDLLSRNELDAASLFATAAAREEFENRAMALKDVRIFDYQILSVKYDEAKHRADVVVRISYFNLYSNKVTTLRDTEEWTYTEEKGIKGWRITSMLPGFK